MNANEPFGLFSLSSLLEMFNQHSVDSVDSCSFKTQTADFF